MKKQYILLSIALTALVILGYFVAQAALDIREADKVQLVQVEKLPVMTTAKGREAMSKVDIELQKLSKFVQDRSKEV